MLTHAYANLPCEIGARKLAGAFSHPLLTKMKDILSNLLKWSTQALLSILIAIGGYIYSELRETSKQLTAQKEIIVASLERAKYQDQNIASLNVWKDKVDAKIERIQLEQARLAMRAGLPPRIGPKPDEQE